MIERRGDLFTSTAPALGHGVNCAGVMGAGIAKTFREKYVHNYENYRAACLAGQLKPGEVHVNYENEKYILNLASQNTPGRDARYEWLFQSALAAATGAVRIGIDRIAIPEIGCGIGGLEWDKAAQTLLTVEIIVDTKMEWEVWHYEG